jgi:aminomethyltransferase
MLKRTPLFAAHQELGAKLVEFGGWEMPVYYSSIVEEHQAVRAAAGVFDISHMGEVFISGPASTAFLNRALTNDLTKLPIGRGQYTLLCNARGGVIDDLYVYRLAETEYLLVLNATRTETDFSALVRLFSTYPDRTEVYLVNLSDLWGGIALQGPRVGEFIDAWAPGPAIEGTLVPSASALRKNQLGSFARGPDVVWLARTGYTGEDGFELLASAEVLPSAWKDLLELGRPYGLVPCGLGARDTLRTEMGYALYGHELTEDTNPFEAGLDRYVALGKGDFVGRIALTALKAEGVRRKCVAFKMTEKSPPPRPQYPLWSVGNDARAVGQVVSGTQSPSLGVGIGMGYVPPEFGAPGTPLTVEVRGQRHPAEVVEKPIYRKPAA